MVAANTNEDCRSADKVEEQAPHQALKQSKSSLSFAGEGAGQSGVVEATEQASTTQAGDSCRCGVTVRCVPLA